MEGKALIGMMKKLNSGLISRNRHFDLFENDQVKYARTSLARIRAIREKMQSPNWKVSFKFTDGDRVAVIIESELFMASWETHLSRLEYDYLRAMA